MIPLTFDLPLHLVGLLVLFNYFCFFNAYPIKTNYHFQFQLMQRPLKTIAKLSGDVYIPRGVSVPALDKDTLWEFQPNKLGDSLEILKA